MSTFSKTSFVGWALALLSPIVVPSSNALAQGMLPKRIQKAVERRYVAYSPAFAERFRLHARDTQQAMPAGLEALEIGFETEPNTQWVRCYVALYIKSSIDIATDLGSDASRDVLEPSRHFFLQPRDGGMDPRRLIGQVDAEHLLKRQARYFQRASFSTSDYASGGSGARMSVALQEQVSDLFPGLHYVRTRGCMPPNMIVHGAGVQVMLRRRDAADDAGRPARWDDDRIVRIAMPGKILNDALPALSAVEQHMQDLIDQENKARRKRSE